MVLTRDEIQPLGRKHKIMDALFDWQVRPYVHLGVILF